MPTIRRRDTARLDLVEHFVYLAENAGLDVADQFLTNAEASFDTLADQPKMGAALVLRPRELAGLRILGDLSSDSRTSQPASGAPSDQ